MNGPVPTPFLFRSPSASTMPWGTMSGEIASRREENGYLEVNFSFVGETTSILSINEFQRLKAVVLSWKTRSNVYLTSSEVRVRPFTGGFGWNLTFSRRFTTHVSGSTSSTLFARYSM